MEITPELLDVKYKAKIRAAMGRLGRPLTSHDAEQWEIGEWYRREYETHCMEKPVKGDGRGGVVEVEVDGEVVEYVTHPDRKCEKCWGELKKKKGPGRWPKMCEGCKKGEENGTGNGEGGGEGKGDGDE